MRHKNWYDRSPMWPLFNHGCPKPAPEEPYNSPYAVLGYDELGAPVFTVHTVDGDEYTVPVENDIVVLKDTTYTLSISEDRTRLILEDSYGNETSVSLASGEDVAGFLSVEDKAKLDGIETGAQVNTVTGVKGSAEASYRTGNVSISKEDLGLSRVENKSAGDILSGMTKDTITNALGYIPHRVASVKSGSFLLEPNGMVSVYATVDELGGPTVPDSKPIVRVFGTDPESAVYIQHGEAYYNDVLCVVIQNTDSNRSHNVSYFINAIRTDMEV